ncbi:MAG: ribonuclease E/G [Rhodobacteraceae bacterium]|nr:ribonuclease E/G [Paracoccaceae bacterium]
MKGAQIVLGTYAGHEAAALMVDGLMDDLLVASDAPAPGTIYRAIVDRQIKGQGGVFLKTPDGQAYLRGVKGLSPGAAITVQVSGYAEPGKAIPVSDRVLFKSRYAIVTPDAPGLNISRQIKDDDTRDSLLEIAHECMAGEEQGLILRSAAEAADLDEIADDILAMKAVATNVMAEAGSAAETLLEGDGPHTLAWRDWTMLADVVTEDGAFEALGVLDQIEEARTGVVKLDAHATAYVEPTRALVAVDVNTGADAGFAAGQRANLALARALPRALRVRGLGGQIVLDLAPMPKKERRGFENALRAAFRKDTVDTVLAGWTPLGHYELQRKRARLPLELCVS